MIWKKSLRVKSWVGLIGAMVLCESVGLAGSVITFPAISSWYRSIQKPPFTPPNWIFGPVWTLLFLLMGWALYLVWQKGIKNKKVQQAMIVFSVQLVLNFGWSLLFFGLSSPAWAFGEILVLWFFILLTILKFYNLNRFAAWLLVPYLLWVSFASVLNWFIVKLN